MRSVSTAKRLRLLSWLVALYGVLIVAGGITGGLLLNGYVRSVPFRITEDDDYIPPSVTRPYEWEGIAVVIGSILLGTLVVVLAELIRLRANLVIEDRAALATTGSRAAPNSAASPPAQKLARRSQKVRGRGRVQVLNAAQSELLAASPPPTFAEGWYPDPLGEADLRRWNGVQWTGEQRSIALPQL